MGTHRHILCLNCGSSSLKFALYRVESEEERLLVRGAAERVGLPEGQLWYAIAPRWKRSERRGAFADHGEALHALFEAFSELHLPLPDAVGHRVVHGGPRYVAPAIVDEALIAELKRIVPYAPLHLPGEIDGIAAVGARYPHLPQVACFDTAFHHRMPELAQRFALPRELWDAGIRRYGFHGLSYEYILEALGRRPPPRLIVAHLGSGASLAAVKEGVPIDTTMGFTPAGGFMMGTRCGDLDAGILLHLMRERGMDADELEALVNLRSGLLGVSETSPDMKVLLAAREKDARAAQAVEMFCYQVRKAIGAMAAALGGLDLLVFTAGIGERSAEVRAGICAGLSHLGIALSEAKNAAHADTISAPESRCRVRVIPTNEDKVIARQTRRVVHETASSSS